MRINYWILTFLFLLAANTRVLAQDTVTREVPISPFYQLVINGAFDVELVSGPEPALQMTGPAALLDLVSVGMERGGLVIAPSQPLGGGGRIGLKVSTNRLMKVKLSGEVDLRTADTFDVQGLTLDAAGPCHASLSLTAMQINIIAASGARVELAGTTTGLLLTLKDHALVDASELHADRATCSMADHSEAIVRVKDKIMATVTDKAKLSYHGTPLIIDSGSAEGSVAPASP